MAWAQAVVEALKLLAFVFGWLKERNDEKRKAKKEVLKEMIDATSQEDMRKLINKFNSI